MNTINLSQLRNLLPTDSGWTVEEGFTILKSFNPEATTEHELARVLGTLINFFLTMVDE